jgi:hypothetical protein
MGPPFIFEPLLRPVVIFAVASRHGPFRHEAAEHVLVDEILNYDMRKRVGIGISGVQPGSGFDALLSVKGDHIGGKAGRFKKWHQILLWHRIIISILARSAP